MNVTLSGWKTYIAAALLAVVAISEGIIGMDIPGIIIDDNWLLILINSLGLTGIRAAIAKNIVSGLMK